MIERYGSHLDYCALPQYQQWLAQWRPPPGDISWVDSEQAWHPPDTGTPSPATAEPDPEWGQHTARQQMQARHGQGTRLVYHLLDSLAIGDRRCVDIGCGHNPHPGLWGVDPHNERHRDEPWTPEWYIANWGRWPHAFSCNAIHYCDQSDMALNVAKVRGVLRPAGTAVITINRARVREATRHYDEERLLQDLAQTPGMTRMVWFDQPQDAWMDGNVWIWLRQ